MIRRTPTKLSRRGAKFIASFEGFRSHPYDDGTGTLTIGYGHTSGVTWNTRPVSQRRARRLLREDSRPVAKMIRQQSGLKGLRQHELDALISAGFNLGPGIFLGGRSLGDALIAGNRREIATAFLLYVYADGRKLEGLVRRRRAERRVFNHGYRRGR